MPIIAGTCQCAINRSLLCDISSRPILIFLNILGFNFSRVDSSSPQLPGQVGIMITVHQALPLGPSQPLVLVLGN